MKVKNANAHSRDTRDKIKECFAELIKEKNDLEKISVVELAKRAGITRSSFYTHYESIYDVAEDIQNETLAVLVEHTEHIKNLDDFGECIDVIIEYLKEHETIYSLILASNEAVIYANNLIDLLRKKFNLIYNNNDFDYQMSIIFYTYGCTNIVIKYFRKEIDYSLDDIGEFMKKALINNFKNI